MKENLTSRKIYTFKQPDLNWMKKTKKEDSKADYCYRHINFETIVSTLVFFFLFNISFVITGGINSFISFWTKMDYRTVNENKSNICFTVSEIY